MKKFLQLMIVAFCIAPVACNDNANNGSGDNNMKSDDTMSSMSDTSSNSMSSSSTGSNSNPVMTKTLDLTSSQEVPANNSKGHGTADVTYNKDTKMLSYT